MFREHRVVPGSKVWNCPRCFALQSAINPMYILLGILPGGKFTKDNSLHGWPVPVVVCFECYMQEVHDNNMSFDLSMEMSQ